MDLDDLITRYRGPLIGLFRSWDVDAADADALAQQTFVEAHFAGTKLPNDATLAGRFLRGIAHNLYRNWRRAKQRRERRFQPLDGAEVVAAPDEPQGDEQVHGAIAALPRRLRQVTWMHYLEETSVPDLAALLGISERAVEGRLHRARQALREKLDAPATRRSPR